MEQGFSDENGGANTPRRIAKEEMEFRRYEARLGVWKIVLGTMIVGLAGVLIPGVINFTTIRLENQRKEAEHKFALQSAHQQYIKDFFDTAVNQDIELRIRFANYFANLSGSGQQELWSGYLDVLQAQRDENRDRIHGLEKDLVELKKVPADQVDVAELDRVARMLNWTYAEIGYVPLDRSVVVVVAGKKERLYSETVAVVDRLASLTVSLDETSDDYVRFWELYRRDLIGVESRWVAQIMVAIGRTLESRLEAGTAPGLRLQFLSADLAGIIAEELREDSSAQISPFD